MSAPALQLDGDVLAAQRGDREAFTRLVDVTRNLVCSIVVTVMRDIDASEDVAQEVFLAAWQGIRRLRNAASFLPWLRQLARNQAHACLRAQRRRRRRLEYADAALARAADPSPAASEDLVSAEEKQVLTDVIDSLPEDAREIVTLYYREDRSARQVAELLDLSEAAVKKRLERARAMVRQALMERFGETLRRTLPGASGDDQ